MEQRTHVSLKSHRLLFALASLLCWQEHLANAASAAPPLAASSTTSSPASASTSTSTSNERHRNQILSFFHKFESHGPTLTLTLRNPSRTTLLGGGGGADKSSNAWSKLWAPSGRGRDNADASPKPPQMVAADDGTFGLSSKLGALFHISSSASTTTTNGQTASSPTSTTSQFADGYMLDDGEIFLDPPSASGSSSSSRGLFSIREMGSGILGGSWGSSKSWSECAQNVHPELRYEMKTKEQQHSSSNDDGDDTRPFPATIPWLSGISCGMIWTPFPTYKPGYPEGYGHKLMSVPHFIRCGARLSLPRFSTMVRNFRVTSRGISNSFTMENNDGSNNNNSNRSTKKDLDLGVTYRESLYRPDSGTLELLVGRSSPSLSPPKRNEIDNRQFLHPSDKYRRRNHILVRLATGHKSKPTDSTPSNQKSILSAIEYAKGSFRMPTPFFLRNNNNTNGGISVSPSFDFVEGTARCVFSGDVGSSGRTRAVLRLDVEDSTLTLVRALDDSKIIAPTISLHSGKIVYDYYLNLDGISGQHESSHDRKANSSIRAHVDPTKGILLKWTDGIRGGTRSGGGGGSCWVTECRIPLGTTAAGPLAADVRVGRRWVI